MPFFRRFFRILFIRRVFEALRMTRMPGKARDCRPYPGVAGALRAYNERVVGDLAAARSAFAKAAFAFTLASCSRESGLAIKDSFFGVA